MPDTSLLLLVGLLNLALLVVVLIALSSGLKKAGVLETRRSGVLWKLLRSLEFMLMNRIQALVARINSLIAIVASVLASLGSIRAKQTNLSASLAKVQADVVSLREQLANVFVNNPDLAAAEAALSSLESGVETLGVEFEAISQEVANAESAAAEIDSLTPEDADGDGVMSDTDQDDNDPNVGAFQP